MKVNKQIKNSSDVGKRDEKEEKNQMNLKREERDMIRNEINKEELSKKFQWAIEEKEKEINRLTSLSSDFEKDLSVAQMVIQR